MLSRRKIEEIGEETGFREDIIEKVLRLEELMSDIFAHPYLNKRFLLKGGTPLNFYYFNTPRLSVDIDLNYIGKIELKGMEEEKPNINKSTEKILREKGYHLIKKPDRAHAGGKWRLGYQDLWGQKKNLEIDINYLFRIPIGNPQRINLKIFKTSKEFEVNLVSKEELFAGKTVAALFRTSPRDLYDLANIAQHSDIYDPVLFRKTVIFLGAAQRKDLRKVKMSAISKITENEIRNSLSSIVPQEEYISKKELLETVKHLVIGLLNFKAEEKEFLEKLLDNAEYAPSLLFGEYPELSVRLEKHPALLWKRLNVEKHLKKG